MLTFFWDTFEIKIKTMRNYYRNNARFGFYLYSLVYVANIDKFKYSFHVQIFLFVNPHRTQKYCAINKTLLNYSQLFFVFLLFDLAGFNIKVADVLHQRTRSVYS